MYVRLGVSQNCVIIGKLPQVYLFLTGGWYPRIQEISAISDAGAVRPGLSSIYRAPFGVNYLQSGRIYFEAVRGEALRPFGAAGFQVYGSCKQQLQSSMERCPTETMKMQRRIPPLRPPRRTLVGMTPLWEREIGGGRECSGQILLLRCACSGRQRRAR
jgi:hypothetical protein